MPATSSRTASVEGAVASAGLKVAAIGKMRAGVGNSLATSDAGRESLGRVEELAAEGSVCADGDCGGGGLGLASVPAAVWASEKLDTGNSSCRSYNKHERGCPPAGGATSPIPE